MTMLVASILVDELEPAGKAADDAFASGADAVELRIDPFDGDPLTVAAFLRSRRDRTWIVTCRSMDEGGGFRGDTMERVSRLIAAARDTGAYVDFEWADWQRSDNIRQKVRMAAASGDARLLLSIHDFSGRADRIAEAVESIRSVPGVRAAKIAYQPEHADATFKALDLMHAFGDDAIAIAMGEAGGWTRVLAKKLGSYATFASVADSAATAPGQLTLERMVKDFRFSEIGPETKVFGVLGDPVAHSMSPLMFNRWFSAAGMNAVYLPIRVTGGEEGLVRFLDGCRSRSWLDIGGFSVTLPHKRAALTWAEEGADWMSRGIGAINTLVFDGGETRAYNTDCFAAVGAIVDALGCRHTDLLGQRVDILGSGGAAQAVLYGLDLLGCTHTLFVREPKNSEALAAKYRCEVQPWSQRRARSGAIVINCTSVGMAPNIEESPLPADAFHDCRLAFDMVYRPIRTRFLADAAAAGATCLSGLDMFLRQAAMQFALWFGQRGDQDAARAWIVDALTAESSQDQSP